MEIFRLCLIYLGFICTFVFLCAFWHLLAMPSIWTKFKPATTLVSNYFKSQPRSGCQKSRFSQLRGGAPRPPFCNPCHAALYETPLLCIYIQYLFSSYSSSPCLSSSDICGQSIQEGDMMKVITYLT